MRHGGGGSVRAMTVTVGQRTSSLGRTLLPLAVVFLAIGISTAVMGPFLSLFLSSEVDAGPLQVTIFLVGSPLAGVAASALVARFSDRRPIRRRLMIAASVAGVLSAGLTAFLRDYITLLATALTATAFAWALYPQAFAYAREVLERVQPSRAAMGISSLRTVFSLAWVAGPPLAVFLLTAGGFRLLYAVAATAYALAGLVAIFLLKDTPAAARIPAAGRPAVPVAADRPDSSAPSPRGVDSAGPSRAVLWLTVAAFTFLQCPMTLGLQALPLYASHDLGGKVADAGLILGLCAFLEIPLMLALGWLTTRVRLRMLLLTGAFCGVVYELLASLATGVPFLVAGQVLNAFFIAAVTGLGITYMQDMLPAHPGRATTLFANSYPIGAVLAGPLFGLAQAFGFRWAFVLSAGLCAAGLAILLVVRPPTNYPSAAPAVAA